MKSGGDSRHVGKLRAALGQPGGAVLFVGAGASIHATGRGEAASWHGLLVEGLRRCAEDHAAPAEWQREVSDLIDAGEMSEAGDRITLQLGGRQSAAHAEWLRDTVGSLRVQDVSWLEAIVGTGQRLVTTNYDDLLAWNGYTESVGSMTDVHGAAMPDVFNLIGRSVTVTTEMKTITELGVKIRGRMIQVQSFDQNGQILSEINHFVPEHADDAGSASAIGPEDRRELYA